MCCTIHGEENVGYWTSSSTGKKSPYCRLCRRKRAKKRNDIIKIVGGKYTKKEWEKKLLESENKPCTGCNRNWDEIPPRPDKRYKTVKTKDHIVCLNNGGNNSIENLQVLCWQCNFKKGHK